MARNISKNKFLFLIFFIFLMSLIKVDYRFEEIEYGKSVDDAEYYYNAVTLAVDYDLDYSNQMIGVKNRFLNAENDSIVPFHPIGSGILAAPFIFISNLFIDPFIKSPLVSFNYFIYSLVSIFYLFLSFNLLFLSLTKLKISFNKIHLSLFIFGTGVTYYAFDRFSMSHIYEFFSVCFVIYLSTKIITENRTNNSNYFLLGFLMYVFLAIRFTNYLLIIIPAILLILQNKKLNKIYLNPLFLFGNFVGAIIFLLHTKYLYGIYTFNQASIVLKVENSFGQTYENFFDLSKFTDNISLVFNSLKIIFFSQEFGLFFFSPIIFVGLIYVIFFAFKKNGSLFLLLGMTYIIPFFSIIVIQNTAFSYGFRYLYVLIPINIIIYFKYFSENIFVKYYLVYFSVLGLLGYIFFETTEYTSISQDYLINSFGMETRYSNPNYLTSLYKSVISFNAYLHIVFTSFIGVLLIKIINLFINPIELFSRFTEITSDIQSMVENSINFSWIKVLLIYFMIFYFLKRLTKV